MKSQIMFGIVAIVAAIGLLPQAAWHMLMRPPKQLMAHVESVMVVSMGPSDVLAM